MNDANAMTSIKYLYCYSTYDIDTGTNSIAQLISNCTSKNNLLFNNSSKMPGQLQTAEYLLQNFYLNDATGKMASMEALLKKSYTCDYCEKLSFSSIVELHNHIKIHEQESFFSTFIHNEANKCYVCEENVTKHCLRNFRSHDSSRQSLIICETCEIDVFNVKPKRKPQQSQINEKKPTSFT